MTSRSTSHIEAKGLAIRANAAIQETRHHVDARYARLVHEITSIMPQNLPEPSSSVIEQKNRPHLQPAALPAKLAKRLQTILLPVFINVRSFTSMSIMDVTLSVRRGRVIVERWTTSGKVVYEVLRPEPSYGIEISMQTTWIFPTRISLVMFLTTRLLARWSLSTSIQIKHHRIVPSNAEIVEAVRTGSVAHVTELFSDGRARPTDVLLNGQSLIHVR